MKEKVGKLRSIIFQSNEASKIRSLVGENKRIVFCTGCFDVLHSGHAIFFEQCGEYGDVLVVGLGRDSTIETLKGEGRPINPEMNRAYLLAGLKAVDFVIFDDKEIGEGKIDFFGVISQLKPNVFVLNDDDSGIEEKKKLCESMGIKLVLVKRDVPPFLKKTSTTGIVTRIKER
jgi:glycerol-3-phosphate cytidylyltransferase